MNTKKNPADIYRQSFETITREADLARFSPGERSVVVRLIHACGMADLADDVVISAGAVDAGITALGNGSPIICDVEMVRRGIITDRLSAANPLLCAIGSEEAGERAQQLRTTRSAGAIDSLAQKIPGSVVAIGNAPTALFHLLEMLHGGLARPALIIGCPVGFVGAEESKQALMEMVGNDMMGKNAMQNNRIGAIPYITVRGRRGGSAMAAAAINALAAPSQGLL